MIFGRFFRKGGTYIKNKDFLRKELRINLNKYTDEELRWMDMVAECFRGKDGKINKIPFDVTKLTRGKLLERQSWKGKDRKRLYLWLVSIGAKGYTTEQIYNVRTCIPEVVRYIYARTGEDYRNEKEKKDIKKTNTKVHKRNTKYCKLV